MVAEARRALLQGPAFIRLLAGLAEAGPQAEGIALSERLGQWIDWSHAVALSRALDGRLPAPAADEAGLADPAGQCARARARLVQAIDDAPELAGPAVFAGEPDFAPFRKRHVALQQSMLMATGRLRGQLRDALSALPEPAARLAEVDALMERVLGPREQSLLGRVPDLLDVHFLRLREQAGAGATPAEDDAVPAPWLARFRRDLRAVLLAELDVRFHPIEGLLAALQAPTTGTP